MIAKNIGFLILAISTASHAERSDIIGKWEPIGRGHQAIYGSIEVNDTYLEWGVMPEKYPCKSKYELTENEEQGSYLLALTDKQCDYENMQNGHYHKLLASFEFRINENEQGELDARFIDYDKSGKSIGEGPFYKIESNQLIDGKGKSAEAVNSDEVDYPEDGRFGDYAFTKTISRESSESRFRDAKKYSIASGWKVNVSCTIPDVPDMSKYTLRAAIRTQQKYLQREYVNKRVITKYRYTWQAGLRPSYLPEWLEVTQNKGINISSVKKAMVLKEYGVDKIVYSGTPIITRFAYDREGRLIAIEKSKAYPGHGEPGDIPESLFLRVDIKYYENGNKENILIRGYSDLYGSGAFPTNRDRKPITYKYLGKYSEEGNLISEEKQHPRSSSKNIYIEYKYNEQGVLTDGALYLKGQLHERTVYCHEPSLYSMRVTTYGVSGIKHIEKYVDAGDGMGVYTRYRDTGTRETEIEIHKTPNSNYQVIREYKEDGKKLTTNIRMGSQRDSNNLIIALNGLVYKYKFDSNGTWVERIGGSEVEEFGQKVTKNTEILLRENTYHGQTATKVKSTTKKTSVNSRRKNSKPTLRNMEEIQAVLRRNKSEIDGLYIRAFRRNPTLQGRLVLRITIAPSGRITRIEQVSSELGDTNLERRLLRHIETINFGAKQVNEVTLTYPIDFKPS